MHCKKWVSMSLSSLAVVCVSFLLTMLTTGISYGLVYHSGDIAGDETWYAADNPHIITDNVNVGYLYTPTLVTLTIEPGCLVWFNSGTALRIGYHGFISGGGALVAVGTSVNPIIFTSSAATPTPGDWAGIIFYDRTSDISTIMDHCTVEYGGHPSSATNIHCADASPTILNCILRHSSMYGIYCDDGSAPTLTNNTVSNNVTYPISIHCNHLGGNVMGNTGSGNGTNAIEVRGGDITSNHTWVPQDFYFNVTSDVIVGSTYTYALVTLTIEPGCLVKFNSGTTLRIGSSGGASGGGALIAVGTSVNPITFTSSASTPAPGDWAGIVFYDRTSDVSTSMDYCTVEYGGHPSSATNIHCVDASPTILNCILRHSSMYGIYCDDGSAPTLTNNTVSNNVTYPISIHCNHLGGNVMGNTGSGNGTNAIEVRGGDITSNHTWVPQDFYFNVTSDVIVGSTYTYVLVTLAIEPGCLVKFNSGTALRIGYYGGGGGGALVAVGTSVNPITFTSSASTPAPGDWDGIGFYGRTDDVSTIMDNCTVEYGGYSLDTNIHCSDASPSIQHCLVRNSDGYGIFATGSGSMPLISCSTITNNVHGVYAASNANPTIGDCSIAGNTSSGVSNTTSSITIDAENNWWGSADGPGGVGPGSGDAVSNYVDYTPWLTSYGTCIIDSSGLTAHYALNEGSGTIASDSSGNGNAGAISGATWTTGKSGGGLGFNGTSNYVSIPIMNNDEITVCAWFYKNVNDMVNADAVFGAYRYNTNMQLREGFDVRFHQGAPNSLEFIVVTRDGSGVRTERTARRNLLNSVGNWYHAAGTYNKTTGEQKLYVNGQLVHTVLHPAGNTVMPMTYYPNMRIGHSRVNNGYFNGSIDDVRLFSRPLSDTEVKVLYNAFASDLQEQYAFDEGAGTIAGDTSGNGNHGSVSGATWTTGKNGGGLSFDGINDFVSVPRMNHDEVSVCAWFYKNANDTTRSDAIFSGFRSNSSLQLREGFEVRFPSTAPDTIEFLAITQDGSGIRSTRTVRRNLGNSLGSWYHVAGTYNKTTGAQRLYVDGLPVHTQTHPAGNAIVPLTLYTDMRIGYSRVNTGYFNGILDDVQLYRRALTDQEVLDIYNGL